MYPVLSALRVLAQRQLTIGTLLVAGSTGALALGAVDEAAPALATSDIGVAMGTASTDVALLADRLGKLPAIALARRARTVMRHNVTMSLATIALLVTAALSGRLSLTSRLLLNEGSALLIIGNGLRLLRAPTRAEAAQQHGPPHASPP